jgi:hypothetical protein
MFDLFGLSVTPSGISPSWINLYRNYTILSLFLFILSYPLKNNIRLVWNVDKIVKTIFEKSKT